MNISIFGFVIVLACVVEKLWLLSALRVLFRLRGFVSTSMLESVIDFAWKAEKPLAVGCIDSFFTLRCFVTTSAFIYSSAWLKRFSKPEILAHCAGFRYPQYFKLFCPSSTSKNFEKILFLATPFSAHCVVL